MFLSSLLEASEQTAAIVRWISVAVCVALLGVIALIGFVGKRQYDGKHIAAAAITLALSFALSYVKVSPVLYGGSITLASFVPLLIYAYLYGVADGLLVGLIFGLLNYISGPYILTPLTFFLDYPLAFASIGVMGIAKKFTKSQTWNVVLGTVAVYVVRFLFHFLSGLIYFAENAVWVELPEWVMGSPAVYSFIYQCIYLPADCLIAVGVLILLSKTGTLNRLAKIIMPKSS